MTSATSDLARSLTGNSARKNNAISKVNSNDVRHRNWNGEGEGGGGGGDRSYDKATKIHTASNISMHTRNISIGRTITLACLPRLFSLSRALSLSLRPIGPSPPSLGADNRSRNSCQSIN